MKIDQARKASFYSKMSVPVTLYCPNTLVTEDKHGLVDFDICRYVCLRCESHREQTKVQLSCTLFRKCSNCEKYVSAKNF